MVTAAEIRDSGEALMAWLRSRDKSDQDLLAIRCILRSLPAVCRDLSGAESASDKNATLYLGSLLRSAWRIGRHDSTDLLPFLNEDSVNRLSPYGRDAVHSAVGMFYAERSDILPAVRSVLSAASAGYLPYRLAGHDAVAIEGNENPLFSPLWHGEPVPEKRSGLPEELRARGGGWVFWADWYEGYLTGQPLDIDLLEKVALIPSAEWDKGDDHVNGIISAIYDEWKFELADVDRPQFNLALVERQTLILRDYIVGEQERARGRNSAGDADLPRLELIKELLKEALEAVDAILERLADPGADQSTALVVVELNLPVIVDAAEKLATDAKVPRVSNSILALAASAKVLVDAGLDPKDAAKFASAEVFGPRLIAWFRSWLPKRK